MPVYWLGLDEQNEEHGCACRGQSVGAHITREVVLWCKGGVSPLPYHHRRKFRQRDPVRKNEMLEN